MFRKLNPLISFCCALCAVLLLSLPWVNAAESDNPPPQPWQINGILAALEDPYPEVQGLAFSKLGQYEAEDLQAALEKPEEIARKAANLLQDEKVDSFVRGSAAEALGNLGEAATPHIPAIVSILQDEKVESYVRGSAVEALGNLGEAATPHIPAIVSILQDEKVNPYVRISAVEALGNLGEAATPHIPTLVSILQDEKVDSNVRISAVSALGNLGEAATPHIPTLVSILQDEKVESYVRGSVTRALGNLGEAATPHIPNLVNILQDEKVDSNVRGSAVSALGNLGEAATPHIRAILDILQDEKVDSNVRGSAAYALGNLGEAATPHIRAILDILQDEKVGPYLRSNATRALGNIGQLKTEEVVVILENTYYDSLSEVDDWRFDTYFLGGGTEEVKTLLTWLGRPKTRPDELTREDGIKTLKLFNQIWEPTADLEQLRPELVRQIANVAKKTPWQLTDLPLLQTHYNNLKGKYNAADTLQAIITNLKGRQQLLNFALTLLAHLAFWIGLIFLYPKFPHVQAIFFWNPWVRRIGGVGYVGFCLTWVPFLRRKLFEPFEPSLLADAGLTQFQSLGYFPTSRVTQRGADTPQPITAAIPRIHKQVVLFGDSGLGKSMFLRHLVQTKTSRRITVYLPARKCEKGVIEAIQAKLHGQARDAAFLKNLIYSGALDICIDGLNEVTADTRAQITQFVENHFQGNIIMTTQPLEWMPPSTAKLYDLQPLSEEQVEEFLVSRREIGRGEGEMGRGGEIGRGDGETRGRGERGSCGRQEGSLADYAMACRRYLAAALCVEQPPEELTAARRILSNPMDLTLIAQMLAQGKQPDLFHLQQQQYAQMAAEYRQEWGHEFPLKKFSAAVYQRRLDDNPALPAEEFYQELISLEDEKYKMVLSRQWQEGEGKPKREWYFRHDKIMDFFLVQNFLGDGEVAASRLVDHMNDSRFRGVYFLLATLMPLAEARELREQLIQYAADTKDHTVSDTFVQLLRTRK